MGTRTKNCQTELASKTNLEDQKKLRFASVLGVFLAKLWMRRSLEKPSIETASRASSETRGPVQEVERKQNADPE